MSNASRSRLLMIVPALLGVWIVVQVVATWLGRWSYPFDLEWMEGGVLAHAWRASEGLPIYQEPAPDFIPMVYPPGYYWTLAVLGKVFGLSHTLGRTVSILGSSAACLALVWGAHRHLGRWWLGLIGAGIYLSTYEASGAFQDLVRPDALAVGLLAWSMVLATDRARHAPTIAGVLLFLAFTVKHNTAIYGAPLALGVLAFRGWRDALRFALVAAIPGALFTVGMQLTTDGHFLGYVVDVPRSHPSVTARLVPGTLRETANDLPILTTALALWALAMGPRVAPRIPVPLHVVLPAIAAALGAWIFGSMPPVNGIPDVDLFHAAPGYALFSIAVVAVPLGLLGMLLERRVHAPWVLGVGILAIGLFSAGLMRAHHGGFINVFMPWHWVLAAALTVLLADLLDELPGWRGAALAAGVATAQLGLGVTALDLDRLVPDEEDVALGEKVVDRLRQEEGPILSAFSPWFAYQAGHAPGFHLIALWDIRHKEGPYRDAVGDISRAVNEHHWGTVLDAQQSMGYGVRKAYEEAVSFEAPGRALMPRTGWRRRPTVILVRPGATP